MCKSADGSDFNQIVAVDIEKSSVASCFSILLTPAAIFRTRERERGRPPLTYLRIQDVRVLEVSTFTLRILQF